MTVVATQQPAAAGLLPSELKEAGWKLERKVVNDDQEHPEFVARNEKLQMQTSEYKTVDEAIEGAMVLQTRSEGKRVSRTKIKQQVKDRSAALPSVDIKLAEVPRSKIRTDGGTQPRGELDQAVVDAYAESMKASGARNIPYEFPPITVFNDGKHYWLADGFHRFFAHKKTFPTTSSMKAQVVQGTKRDAVLFSLGANSTHGLPRSNTDKRRAVWTLLKDKEWAEWSDNVIAEKANVSQPFVSSLRREWELTQRVMDPIEPGPSDGDNLKRSKLPKAATKRRGKDNVVRETSNIGKGKRKPSKPVDSWALKEKARKERVAATLAWLRPACVEAATLLVTAVEKGNKKLSEQPAAAAIRQALNADVYCDNELAKRRGWKNGSSAVEESELKKLSFAQLAGYAYECVFWSSYYAYQAELEKDAIALLKQFGIAWPALAAKHRELAVSAAPAKQKAKGR